MTIFERLDKFFKLKGLTINKVSSVTSISPGLLSKGLKKENASLGSEKIITILEYFPDLSAEWLLRGEGSMVLNLESNIESMIIDNCQLCGEKDNTIDALKKHIEHMNEEIQFLRNRLNV